MITGTVSDGLEAIVRVRLRGPQGAEQEIDAILDTGFTGALVISLATAVAMGLPLLDQEEIMLADNSIIAVSRYEGRVLWDNTERTVIAHCLEGDSLIGMSLIHAHLLTMTVVSGGEVTLKAL